MRVAENTTLKATFGFINGPSVSVHARQRPEIDAIGSFIETVRAKGGIDISEIAKVIAKDTGGAFEFEFANELYWVRHYADPLYRDGLAACTVDVTRH